MGHLPILHIETIPISVCPHLTALLFWHLTQTPVKKICHLLYTKYSWIQLNTYTCTGNSPKAAHEHANYYVYLRDVNIRHFTRYVLEQVLNLIIYLNNDPPPNILMQSTSSFTIFDFLMHSDNKRHLTSILC